MTNSAIPASVRALAHVAIRTSNLRQSIAFYSRVLGLHTMPRPPFTFEGAWLGTGQGDALIHLIGGTRAAGPDGRVSAGSGAVDHVSLSAQGLANQQARLAKFGLPFRVTRVPQSTLAQLFVYDPNGVLIELTFDMADEPGTPVEVGGVLAAFDPAHYAQFND
jgi:catechol 2,3-dioxygenase-like lactoylglutathione lyase family enzyme